MRSLVLLPLLILSLGSPVQAAESATAMTRAPAWLAAWTTRMPTPPMPSTTAVWPSRSRDSRVACTAVIPAQVSTAAVAKSTDSGTGTRLRSGTATYSASPPSMLKPSCPGSLSQMLGRPVLDETGLDGRFKYKLEFRPDDAARRALALAGQPVPDDGPRPSIFTAIKGQLGMERQTRKGPVTSVVIERIERPTEN